MDSTISTYEKGCNEGQAKRVYKQGNSKKVQRVLREKFNKQIKTNRKINYEFFGGKEIRILNKIFHVQ